MKTSFAVWIKKGLLGLLLSTIITFSYAAATDISNLPLNAMTATQPNLVFILDDSDSVDQEILLNTYAGALWWNGTNKAFTNNTGKPLTPPNFIPGNNGGTLWFEYIYLFPNGNANPQPTIAGTPVVPGTRRTPDDFYFYYGYYAVPPIPAYAWLRDYEYNPLYYNPNVTYVPWPPVYVNNGKANYYQGSITFANANPAAAPSDPAISTSPTMNLTATITSQARNFTFRMVQGMTIPGASIAGITARTVSPGGAFGAWQNIATDLVIPNNISYEVSIPYYPATYYVIDSTCTGAAPACATGPDGKKLRRYEIKPGVTFPSGRSYTDEIQNFANWFTYYRKRRYMLASAMGVVLPQTYDLRAAVVTLNNVQLGVTTTINMADLNSNDPAQNANAILGVFTTNQSAVQNKQTAAAAAHYVLDFVGKQYMNNTNIIQNACQVNAAMYVTDGYPDGPPYAPGVPAPNYTRGTYGSSTPYTPLYTSPTNTTLADIALYYYTINLRPSFPTGLVPVDLTDTSPNADKNKNLHMNTYALSLTAQGNIYGTGTAAALDPFGVPPPIWPTLAEYTSGAPQMLDDMWHATINGRGLMYDAQSFVNVSDRFQSVIADLFLKDASSSAVGLASPNITSTNNTIYAASYNGTAGNLEAYTVNLATGQLTPVNLWNAQTQLDQLSPNNRIIVTYNGSGAIPFRWDSLTNTMKTQLNSTIAPPGPNDGEFVLNWLRGDKSKEVISYRKRNHILGDIVNAAPVVVGNQIRNFTDDGYAAFYNSQVKNRSTTIYVGANDGMLHAFDATTGAEKWAYMPGILFNQLKNLSSKTYHHLFYVDSTPTVGEVAINNSSSWRTLLVGGLNAGGKGYYAIDVTNPNIANEAELASKVLWEFPNASTPASVANNIGLSFGKALFVKTKAAGWVVLVTSGYNNTAGDGKGHLFVLNPDTGALIKDIPTTSGSAASPSGLAQISAFAKNWDYDASIDYAYGGDLNGNVWRFDLSGDSVSSWNVALLASLVDSSGNPQPIMTAPQLSTVDDHRMIYVGTGQFLGKSDLSTSQIQSMYGLVDNMTANPTITDIRNTLVKQVVSGTTISSTPIDFSVKKGWYFDFPKAGERTVTNATLAFGALVFDTSVPSSSGCTVESYQYVVDKATGGMLNVKLFGNDTPWAVKVISKNYVSSPTIVLLPNNQLRSIIHNADDTFTVTNIPSTLSQPSAKQVGWREVIIH